MSFFLRTSLGLGLAVTIAIATPAFAEDWNRGDVAIYYAPQHDLEAGDVALIGRARETIDIAAYDMTSKPIITALAEAAERGVRIRIYLDRSKMRGSQSVPNRNWFELAPLRKSGVEIKVKRRGALMHLNTYAIDGQILRTGSASFEPSDMKRYDSDMVIINSSSQAGEFTKHFDELWNRKGNSKF